MGVRDTEVSSLTSPLIAGRYSLGTPLGAGGVAIVRRGWDTQTGRAIALKSARAEDIDGPVTVRAVNGSAMEAARSVSRTTLRWRIEREGRIMAALTHPHIARVYDYIELDGWPWLVMELVEGVDLRRAVIERGPLSTLAVLRVGRQMCAALASIHAAGIIHRDIKPQNIILSSIGHATLIDFDLAWTPALRDDSEPGMVYGTPEYMAPEQAMGERVTAATDLYSLGVTLYELLAGAPPFHSGQPSAIMWRHVTEKALPLREWRHDLPAPVERVVMRALAKEPRARYPSATAMERAIAQAEDAARLTPVTSRQRAIAAPERTPRAIEAPPPVPALDAPAPVPAPSQESSKPRPWLVLTLWALALIGLTLALILLAMLSQRLPS